MAVDYKRDKEKLICNEIKKKIEEKRVEKNITLTKMSNYVLTTTRYHSFLGSELCFYNSVIPFAKYVGLSFGEISDLDFIEFRKLTVKKSTKYKTKRVKVCIKLGYSRNPIPRCIKNINMYLVVGLCKYLDINIGDFEYLKDYIDFGENF